MASHNSTAVFPNGVEARDRSSGSRAAWAQQQQDSASNTGSRHPSVPPPSAPPSSSLLAPPLLSPLERDVLDEYARLLNNLNKVRSVEKFFISFFFIPFLFLLFSVITRSVDFIFSLICILFT
jgi:hypothetical protein